MHVSAAYIAGPLSVNVMAAETTVGRKRTSQIVTGDGAIARH